MKGKRLFAAAWCAAFLAMSIAVVCPAAEQQNTAVKEETAKKKKPIGEKQKGARKAKMKNESGKDIKAFAIREETTEEFTENLLAEGDVFADGETRTVYYMPSGSEETASVIQLTFADDTTAELHAFVFSEMKKPKIRLEEGTAYLVYKKGKEEISTLEEEWASAQETVWEDDGLTEYDDYYDDVYYDSTPSYTGTYYDNSAGQSSAVQENSGGGQSSAVQENAGGGQGNEAAEENCLQGGLMN